MNGSGMITGYYLSDTGQSGFVRGADGSYTTFDAPGSGGTTYALRINETGDITGYYLDSESGEHGYVRAADGTFTTFDVKGAGSTEGWGINKKGEIAGQYYYGSGDIACGTLYQCHGFVRTSRGKIKTFDPAGSTNTWAWKINDKGSIVGAYLDASGTKHGFVRTTDGTITTFDPPGSMNTNANSINNKGAIAGTYRDAKGEHLYFRGADGTISSFDLPQECVSFGVNGLNDKGQIVGFCVDVNYVSHGFVRRPGGKINIFDPPGSFYTVSRSSDAGEVMGYYRDNADNFHGYLRTR
ncbi:MAG TPA: hypothetical protein VHY79_09040 [Rhizomicrobium sp.]|nr:hypothetical protein [Rhizomicrobium sp.]